MDLERKIELISRPPTEEVLTPEELRELLETKEHPIAYGGWEPSGLVHLGMGLICSYKMKDFIEAGVKFKIYLSTWHAFLNNKLGGDMDLIRKAARHFLHTWEALGVPIRSVEVIRSEDEYKDIEYWNRVMLISKELTLSRARRTLEIAGRRNFEANHVSDLLYTPMQVADIFHFDVDICQLGMDQRKAHVVAREIGEKFSEKPVMGLKFWKPVCVHHHLLQGLSKPPVWPIPKESEKEILSSVKMSKSKPETCIFVYDSPEDIKRKILNSFCPEKALEHNPVIEICKYVIFREHERFIIEREQKYGGSLELQSFDELARVYSSGKLHPMDLKNAVAEELIKILAPVREYFEKNREAREILEQLKGAKITR
jgi:tyrosyl-tRNA synthetase